MPQQAATAFGRDQPASQSRPGAPFQARGAGSAAMASRLGGLIAGRAFLTGLWTFPGGLPLGTPLLFDVGVFLTVFGSAMHMIDKLTGVRQ